MQYEICSDTTRRFFFIPDDLRYFKKHFICEPLSSDWEVPPVRILGKSYAAADFVSWMACAPVISENAKCSLEEICSGLVEFLPFHAIKGKPYFAMNVLSQNPKAPIHKPGPNSVPLVDERFGAVVRDRALSGVALADPAICIGRRVVRGESLHDFPGLIG